MVKWYEKLSWWKGVSDWFLYLVIFGMLTNIIGKEFYLFASLFIMLGFIVNTVWLVKQMIK